MVEFHQVNVMNRQAVQGNKAGGDRCGVSLRQGVQQGRRGPCWMMAVQTPQCIPLSAALLKKFSPPALRPRSQRGVGGGVNSPCSILQPSHMWHSGLRRSYFVLAGMGGDFSRFHSNRNAIRISQNRGRCGRPEHCSGSHTTQQLASGNDNCCQFYF